MRLPDTLLHFYKNPRGPFLSITRLEPEEAMRLGETMDAGNTWAHERFAPEHREHYLAERRRNERAMYEEFLARGGKPRLRHPLYFMFEVPGLAARHADARCVRRPLSHVPPEILSCTYIDSGAAYGIPRDPEGPPPFLPTGYLALLGRLYRIEEFRDLVDRVGMPRGFYMEAQVWDVAPLRERGTTTGDHA